MSNPIKKLLLGLLQSNIFISLCAVGLSIETSLTLQQTFLPFVFCSFIFFATFFAYNLYYFKKLDELPYRLFAMIGLVGACVSLFFMTEINCALLVGISVLSIFYIAPIFISFEKCKNFSLHKLVLLIAVWSLLTFVLPIHHLSYDFPCLILFLYRLFLLSILCTLFYIKDEIDINNKRIAQIACYLLNILQFVSAMVIMWQLQFSLGLIYAIISILVCYIVFYFNAFKRSNHYYLFFVDGIMLLQTIFVVINYFS